MCISELYKQYFYNIHDMSQRLRLLKCAIDLYFLYVALISFQIKQISMCQHPLVKYKYYPTYLKNMHVESMIDIFSKVNMFTINSQEKYLKVK